MIKLFVIFVLVVIAYSLAMIMQLGTRTKDVDD